MYRHAFVFALMVALTHADWLDDIFASVSFLNGEEAAREREEERFPQNSSNLLFEKYSLDLGHFFGGHKPPHLSFQWSDCGGQSDPARIKSITLSPDPLKVPGQVTLGFQFQLNKKISAPVRLDVEIKKKVAFLWVKVRSYSYPDFCSNIASVTCPTQFPNCHCPYMNGMYTLPPSLLKVSQVQVPGGQYQVTGWFKQNNVEIACVWTQVSVS